MILLDREYVDKLELPPIPFTIEIDIEELPAPGPFLLVVHDEAAWAGQQTGHLYRIAEKRNDPKNLQNWRDLADLYAESMGISRQSLVLRYKSMKRQTRRRPVGLGWMQWENVYHWPEGGDLAWSAILHGDHPWLEVREHEGRRQVMHR